MLNKDLSKYSNLFPNQYTELRIQENRSNGVALLNGDVINNGKSASSGVSARIFDNGHWGFASNPNILTPPYKILAHYKNNKYFNCTIYF